MGVATSRTQEPSTLKMIIRKLLVQLLALLGLGAASYAMFVESKLANNPFYKPACETSWGSCSTVFKSPHAHILSHWGIVPKGHLLDLSLSATGIMVYSVYLLYPTKLFRLVPQPHKFLLLMSIAGCLFSCYLLYVLKFILQDFCIVCTTFHITNFSMFAVVLFEYRNPTIHRLPEAVHEIKAE